MMTPCPLLPIMQMVGDLLAGDPRFTQKLGAGVLTGSMPDVLTKLPTVVYIEDNQDPTEYADDMPTAREATVSLHVYTSGTKSTFPLASAIDTILIEKGWSCDLNGEVDEPLTKYRHRVLRYRRRFTALDMPI